MSQLYFDMMKWSTQLHPLLKEIDGKLLLCESRIDQELILGGCIAEENIIHEDLQNLPATPYVVKACMEKFFSYNILQ